MVAVKGIYHLFTLGIRFSGLFSVCSRAERRIGNSVGGTLRDFMWGGRWWWHKTLKLFSLSRRINLCISLFLSFIQTHDMWQIADVQGHPVWGVRQTLHLQRCHTGTLRWEAGPQAVAVTLLKVRSAMDCTHYDLSALIVVIKGRHAICSPRRPAAVTLSILQWLTRAEAPLVCSSFQPVAPPVNGVIRLGGSVI